jgi:predicted  nucleic acid-binding Zn-ribbon protein
MSEEREQTELEQKVQVAINSFNAIASEINDNSKLIEGIEAQFKTIRKSNAGLLQGLNGAVQTLLQIIADLNNQLENHSHDENAE